MILVIGSQKIPIKSLKTKIVPIQVSISVATTLVTMLDGAEKAIDDLCPPGTRDWSVQSGDEA